MLPFLKKNQEGSASSPVEHVTRDSDHEDEELDSLSVAAGDIMQAIKSGNQSHLADSLKAFFEMCDSEPHYEGEHE